MDTDVFNAVFWSFFITSVIGLILKCSSMAYKSKCKEVSLCCLKIVRDTEVEENLDEAEAQRVPQIKKIGIIFFAIFLVKYILINSIRIYFYKKTTTNTRGYYQYN